MRAPETSTRALPLRSISGALGRAPAFRGGAFPGSGARGFLAGGASSAAALSSWRWMRVAPRWSSSKSSLISAGLRANCTTVQLSFSRLDLAVDACTAPGVASTLERVRILRMAAARICERLLFPSKRPSSVRRRLSSNSLRKRSRRASSSALNSSSAAFLSRSNSSVARRMRISRLSRTSSFWRTRVSSSLRCSILKVG
mmetsp:Transcript_16699/g.44956  ORF Transcript_16699/g.44956 Transcript_16699/m.44956 type:complete len:200 (+) Transcript_16699:685-1284(+)